MGWEQRHKATGGAAGRPPHSLEPAAVGQSLRGVTMKQAKIEIHDCPPPQSRILLQPRHRS
ncbi:Hypothetical protein SMAX5B_004082 [Scophthalmus maximus]|uniref:Uncharacterized protein n=1 Tax=Scophthalmus maximus TaxID=52904 RepID=A0A2U9B8D6_SCOMX|nr:Hypothetical protein SMAX5B_004082 [Scophthalmus maximus]